MRVGIIQSCYVPWRGFFDFIASVDLFIIFDDIPYPMGRSWRNRNQIKTNKGLRWMSVPVISETRHGNIDEVLISSNVKPWQNQHSRLLHDSLRTAPYFKDMMEIWEAGVSVNDSSLSSLNVRLIRLICEYLAINTPIELSRKYTATGVKTDRLIDLCRKTGATSYLSGPAAKDYLDEKLFAENGIGLEYKTYDYPPYPQQWGDFAGAVTVLDLIANCGSGSKSFLRSNTANEIAVSPTSSPAST